jgi:hypothetical protein
MRQPAAIKAIDRFQSESLCDVAAAIAAAFSFG